MRSFRLSVALVLALATATSWAQEGERLGPNGQPLPEPYSFSYSADSLGAVATRQESGDASGRVTGFYTIAGSDGRERRVDYVADAQGYRATVSSNEIGLKPGDAADVRYQVSQPSDGQLSAQAQVDAAAAASRQQQPQLQQPQIQQLQQQLFRPVPPSPLAVQQPQQVSDSSGASAAVARPNDNQQQIEQVPAASGQDAAKTSQLADESLQQQQQQTLVNLDDIRDEPPQQQQISVQPVVQRPVAPPQPQPQPQPPQPQQQFFQVREQQQFIPPFQPVFPQQPFLIRQQEQQQQQQQFFQQPLPAPIFAARPPQQFAVNQQTVQVEQPQRVQQFVQPAPVQVQVQVPVQEQQIQVVQQQQGAVKGNQVVAPVAPVALPAPVQQQQQIEVQQQVVSQNTFGPRPPAQPQVVQVVEQQVQQQEQPQLIQVVEQQQQQQQQQQVQQEQPQLVQVVEQQQQQQQPQPVAPLPQPQLTFQPIAVSLIQAERQQQTVKGGNSAALGIQRFRPQPAPVKSQVVQLEQPQPVVAVQLEPEIREPPFQFERLRPPQPALVNIVPNSQANGINIQPAFQQVAVKGTQVAVTPAPVVEVAPTPAKGQVEVVSLKEENNSENENEKTEGPTAATTEEPATEAPATEAPTTEQPAPTTTTTQTPVVAAVVVPQQRPAGLRFFGTKSRPGARFGLKSQAAPAVVQAAPVQVVEQPAPIAVIQAPPQEVVAVNVVEPTVAPTPVVGAQPARFLAFGTRLSTKSGGVKSS